MQLMGWSAIIAGCQRVLLSAVSDFVALTGGAAWIYRVELRRLLSCETTIASHVLIPLIKAGIGIFHNPLLQPIKIFLPHSVFACFATWMGRLAVSALLIIEVGPSGSAPQLLLHRDENNNTLVENSCHLVSFSLQASVYCGYRWE